MRIAILQPVLPPRLDGVGDHTAHLAVQLARAHDVTVFGTAPADPDAFPGVQLELSERTVPEAVPELLARVRSAAPDWLLVQYTGFGYGRTGISPRLVLGLRSTRKTGTRVALLAHEAFVPPRGVKLAALWAAQSTQFLLLGRGVDRVLTTTEAWRDRFSRWFGDRRVSFVRIGSNIPPSPLTRTDARARLGLGADVPVAVVFGGLGAHRDADVLRAGLAVLARRPDAVALYVGPDVDQFLAATKGLLLTARPLGTLAADDVSTALRSADMALAPFIDGVSARRGSFLAALQHGLPCVTTVGPLTGPSLERAMRDGVFAGVPYGDPGAFADRVDDVLVDEARRAEMGERARRYHDENHAWAVVGDDVLHALAGGTTA